MKEKNTCKSCNSIINTNNFCGNCGQKIYDKRFTIHSFFMSLLDALDINKGFFYTIRMLFIKPDKVIYDYLKGSTISYFNPLKYLLIISGIYIALILIENKSEKIMGLNNSSEKYFLIHLIAKNMHLIPILLLPFFSIVTKWFYKSKRLFYGEYLIMSTFLILELILIRILLILIKLIFPVTIDYFINQSINDCIIIIADDNIYNNLLDKVYKITYGKKLVLINE